MFQMKMQIVDSVIALFRVDFTGRGELADRQVLKITYDDSVASLYVVFFQSMMPVWICFVFSKSWLRCSPD